MDKDKGFLKKVKINNKKSLREKMLTLLRNHKEEERLAKSRIIFDRLFRLPEFRKALTILFYFPFNGEVNTVEMIKQAQKLGKRIGLPRIMRDKKRIIPAIVDSLEEDLETGPYGIKQPKTNRLQALRLENLDMVIVPGVAFDKRNNRLGRGGGYYDRFLKSLPSLIPTVGLAFDFQIVDHLPQQEKHDIPVTKVLIN